MYHRKDHRDTRSSLSKTCLLEHAWGSFWGPVWSIHSWGQSPSRVLHSHNYPYNNQEEYLTHIKPPHCVFNPCILVSPKDSNQQKCKRSLVPQIENVWDLGLNLFANTCLGMKDAKRLNQPWAGPPQHKCQLWSCWPPSQECSQACPSPPAPWSWEDVVCGLVQTWNILFGMTIGVVSFSMEWGLHPAIE